MKNVNRVRFPSWMRKKLSTSTAGDTESLLHSHKINTVCQSALCPNKNECFSKHKATFLIMGPTCSRRCTFCAVPKEPLSYLDEEEPSRVASAARDLKLQHVVITSVTRDDLEDGGAEHFARTVRSVHQNLPDATVEILIPDFKGNQNSLDTVCSSGIKILNHNLETVARLYSDVRPQASYRCSLNLIEYVHKNYPNILTKSGIMLGLSETKEDVFEAIKDLRHVGTDILTIGQYLQPNKNLLPVHSFVSPEDFELYGSFALSEGFKYVSSSPYVRSSYNADKVLAHIGR